MAARRAFGRQADRLADDCRAPPGSRAERGAAAGPGDAYAFDDVLLEIEQAAYEYAKSIDDDERVIVGLNKYRLDDDPEPKVLSSDPDLERGQCERLAAFKADREMSQIEVVLDDVVATARGTQNLMYPMKAALRANASLGEVSDALRGVFGLYTP